MKIDPFDKFLLDLGRFLAKWEKKRKYKEKITKRDEDNLREIHKAWYKLNINISTTEN